MGRRFQGKWLWPLIASFLILPWDGAGAAPAYVRSGRCQSCHKAIYDMWKDTLHNKSQQIITPTNDTVVVGWNGMLKLKAENIPEVVVKLNNRFKVSDEKSPADTTVYVHKVIFLSFRGIFLLEGEQCSAHILLH